MFLPLRLSSPQINTVRVSGLEFLKGRFFQGASLVAIDDIQCAADFVCKDSGKPIGAEICRLRVESPMRLIRCQT
jgi:hypothetical protein